MHFLQSKTSTFTVVQNMRHCNVNLHSCAMHHRPQIARVNAINSRYLTDRELLTRPAKQYYSTLVIRLLLRSCPADVSWLVVSIVIDAIKCRVWRCRAEIVEEGLKVVTPLLIHTDATRSIARILFIGRGIAARFSVFPRYIFAGTCRARMSVDSTMQRNEFPFQASATLAVTTQQVVLLVGRRFATLAAAFVVVVMASFTGVTQYRQLPEDLSRFQISDLFHRWRFA